MNHDPVKLACAKVCLQRAVAMRRMPDAKAGAIECAKAILECTGSDIDFARLREEVIGDCRVRDGFIYIEVGCQ